MFTNILEPSHLIIILIVALVLLGPKRLPEAGRALGQGLKEFKSSINATHEPAPQITPAHPKIHEDSPPSADTPH
jgi:sec-independent protein translocase protein TatA